MTEAYPIVPFLCALLAFAQPSAGQTAASDPLGVFAQQLRAAEIISEGPGRVFARATIATTGQTIVTIEIDCEGRSAIVRDRAAFTQDFYPTIGTSCDSLAAALRRAGPGRR